MKNSLENMQKLLTKGKIVEAQAMALALKEAEKKAKPKAKPVKSVVAEKPPTNPSLLTDEQEIYNGDDDDVIDVSAIKSAEPKKKGVQPNEAAGLASSKPPKNFGQKFVDKDGKEHTRSFIKEWTTPKVQFKSDGVPSEKLNYPAPTQRRDPQEKIILTCSLCSRRYKLYPSEATGAVSEGMMFKCNSCITQGK